MAITKLHYLVLVSIAFITGSCGGEKFGAASGGSQTTFNSNQQAAQTPVSTGSADLNAGNTGVGNGNLQGGTGNVGTGTPSSPGNGNLQGGAGNVGTGTGTDTPSSPGNGNTQVGASGVPWTATTVITDFGTLEKCKWDILQATGDFSICMKCFDQWMGNGGKITAAECGCFKTPGDIPAQK